MTARDPFGKNNRFCRGCGCTEHDACALETVAGLQGCAWIVLDLDAPTGFCSACAIAVAWDQTEIHAFAQFDAPRHALLVAS